MGVATDCRRGNTSNSNSNSNNSNIKSSSKHITMISGWITTAVVVLVASLYADAAISVPTATVACTQTGFTPLFTQDFPTASEVIGWEVDIGGVSHGDAACSASHANVASDGDASETLTGTDFTVGGTASAEIPYTIGGTPVCGGTLAYSTDTNEIEYIVAVDITVTETLRGVVNRQLKYVFELKCHLVRAPDPVTSSAQWTIIDALVTTSGGTNEADTFTFPIEMNMYTDNARGTTHDAAFTMQMGQNLHLRLSETAPDSNFKFITQDCWSTPDAAHAHGTRDNFFVNMCPVDSTTTFVDVNTDGSDSDFDINIEAFFFDGSKASAIYFHCQVLICKQGDSAGACVQQTTAGCAGGKRKRRDIVRGGPIETRTLTSKQHIILDNTEILTPECAENAVWDRSTKQCAANNIMEVKGVYLDIPWKEELANTSSKAFKDFAQEKAYQIFALLQLSEEADRILGVKVVGARQGSVILDVQIVYAPTMAPAEAFTTFKKAIHNPPIKAQRVVNILNIRRDKVVEYIDIAHEPLTDVNKMIIIVLVVVLVAVLFISGLVIFKLRQIRRVPSPVVVGQVKSFENPTLECVS